MGVNLGWGLRIQRSQSAGIDRSGIDEQVMKRLRINDRKRAPTTVVRQPYSDVESLSLECGSCDLPATESATMTNHDYMNLMTQWVRADHDPAFVALPFSNGLAPSAGRLALRCSFSEDTPDLMQLWFILDEVDSKGVDHLVDMLEASDEIDEQAEGLGHSPA